jgi:hypothetical protein
LHVPAKRVPVRYQDGGNSKHRTSALPGQILQIRWGRFLVDLSFGYTIRPATARPAPIGTKKKWGLLLPGAPEPRLTLLRRQGCKIGISNR